MIIVMCDSWQSAQDAYKYFIDFLLEHDRYSILDRNDCCLTVRTIEDIRYIFVDENMFEVYHLAVEFKNDCRDAEFIEEGNFFNELHQSLIYTQSFI